LQQRLTYLLVVLLFVIIPSAFAQSPQRGVSIAPNLSNTGTWGTYHALIIGINDYKEWPKLQTAVKDASVIRDTLVSRYGFDKENVILRTDKSASRLQITRDLRYLAQSMGKDDNLLIYYAGHGQLDDFTGDGYWVPAEGALKNPSTWVANSYIKAILSSEKLQAKNVMVIADSCYSGAMLRGGSGPMSLDDRRYSERLAEKAALRSRQVISSGGIEPVADGGADGHSLFAFYLIDALRKNDREVIDLENLFHTKVWKPVTEIGDQRPNVGRLKTPMDQDGQFVLYNAAWVKQQAQKQVALEAKKQEQARQKTAVASAELELQRQRFEMEKQKLTYEKEQLTQQKALEIERLSQQKSIEMERHKLEKQKQEFEYAKLQARLEEMEKREKQEKEQPMIASVAPSVMAQSSSTNRRAVQKSKENESQPLAGPSHELTANGPLLASVTHSRKTSRPNYKIALFPVMAIDGYGGKENVHNGAVNAIASISEDDDRLEFKLSYKGVEGLSDKVDIISDNAIKQEYQIWTRASIFSRYEPDWEKIKKIGLKIDADLAVMLYYRWTGETILDVYIFDIRTQKVYSRKKKSITYYDYKASIKKEVLKVMNRYFETQ
jgi:uncharacterized caspase-like protein